MAAAVYNLVAVAAVGYIAAAADSDCAGSAVFNQKAPAAAWNSVCGILPGRRAQRVAD